jgi:hypothetical protein
LEHPTNFSKAGEFIIEYMKVDESGNYQIATRTLVVLAQTAAAKGGLGKGGSAALVLFFLLIIAVVCFLYKEQLMERLPESVKNVFVNPMYGGGGKSGGKRGRRNRPTLPPPEAWFHGPINRTQAEERLRAAGQPSGVYLVRSKESGEGEYALSVLTPKRCIHYVVVVPANTSEPMTFQSKPIPGEWGANLRAVINYLGRKKEDVIPVLLKIPAPLPDNGSDKLFRLAHKAYADGGDSIEDCLYDMVTQENDQHSLGTAYTQHLSGVYYRVFYPRSSHFLKDVPVFIRQNADGGPAAGKASDQFVELGANEDVSANVALFVKLDPEDLSSHLSGNAPDDGDDDGGVMYTAVDVGGAAEDEGDVMYTAVDVGGAAEDEGDVMYTAVDVGGPAEDEGDVMYTAVDVAGGSNSDPTGFGEEEGDVMYTAVDVGGGGGESSVDEFGGFGDVSSSVVAAATKPKAARPNANNSKSNASSRPPSSSAAASSKHKGGQSSKAASGSTSQPPARKSIAKPRHASAAADVGRTGSGGGGRSGAASAASKPRNASSAAATGRGARSVSQTNMGAAKASSSVPEWLHGVTDRKASEAKIEEAGGQNGLFLVRPRDATGLSHAFSVKLRGRFVHRLIEQKVAGGPYSVDKQTEGYGSTLSEVVEQLQATMATKHSMEIIAVLRPGASAPLSRNRPSAGSVYEGFQENDDNVSSL